MDEKSKYEGIVLHRFFEKFKNVTYHQVSIAKFLYFQFLGYLRGFHSLDWAKKNLPDLGLEINRFNESTIFSWADEPYPFDPHPDGVILMRGGFVDIASKNLPKEGYFLISHNQEEVNLIRANMPDQTPHNIEDYFRDNPQAIAALTQQITQIISEEKSDPILGDPRLLQWFIKVMPKTVNIFDAVHSLFEQIDVSAVLTISSINWMESALNLFARINRIPSFTGQHGIIVDKAIYGHVPILATQKLVWGKAVEEWYQKYGVPKSRIFIAGSPRFDIILQQTWWDKAKLCQALNIDPSQKIIIFTTQRLCLSKESVPLVLEALQTIPDVCLVLLLHPSEHSMIEAYRQLIKDNPICRIVKFGHISLYDALNGADFFVTGYSTSALEAMLFKLPVITVEPSPLEYSFGDAGASIKVTAAKEFNSVIKRLIADETFRNNAVNRYQKYISDQCVCDGSTAKRIFDQIKSTCLNGGTA